jgi:hypothetical protein
MPKGKKTKTAKARVLASKKAMKVDFQEAS